MIVEFETALAKRIDVGRCEQPRRARFEVALFLADKGDHQQCPIGSDQFGDSVEDLTFIAWRQGLNRVDLQHEVEMPVPLRWRREQVGDDPLN